MKFINKEKLRTINKQVQATRVFVKISTLRVVFLQKNLLINCTPFGGGL